MSLNYYKDITQVLNLTFDQVRVDQIIPTLRDPQLLKVVSVNEKSLKMELSNYILVFKGQFINTRFDYFYTLTCDFKKPKEVTQIEFDFFTYVNNYSQRVP